MSNFVHRLMNRFEIDLKSDEKNERLYSSSRELVAMLFAVVVGVGLEKINAAWGTKDPISIFQLFVVYAAIILSWWGYNFGTIEGPSETNLLNYGIDCFLLVLYWALINWWSNTEFIFSGFILMFMLYWAWELVRLSKAGREQLIKEKIARASLVNFSFGIAIIALAVYFVFSKLRLVSLITLFGIIFWYRIKIHQVYSASNENLCKKDTSQAQIEPKVVNLIEAAKTISQKAKIHLSGFPVGAAILSDSDNIYVGCNVEFDNYSNTIHAEEAAISEFVVSGDKKPVAIAVFTAGNKPNYPCGMCRQSLIELGGKELRVIAAYKDKYEIKTLGELLPDAFRLGKEL